MEAYESWEHSGLLVEIVHDDEGYGYGPQDYDNAGMIYSWTSAFLGDEKISEPDGIIYVPDTETDDGYREDVSLKEWFAYHYDAALTIPLRFSDYGSNGAGIYEYGHEDANCALVFTQKEIDEEWGGYRESHDVQMKDAEGNPTGEVREYGGALAYAKGRIKELDQWLSGNVWGIVVREPSAIVGLSLSCKKLRTFTGLNALSDAEEYVGTLPNAQEGIYYIDYPCGEGKVLDSISGMIGDPDDEYIVSEANGMAEAAREEIEDEVKEAEYWACRGVLTV